MGNIQSYRDLVAWKLATECCLEVYRITKEFPADERFGLVSQTRRAAVSIPSNIAEGYGRGRPSDYARFLRVARGSLFELESQLIIACRLGYVEQRKYQELEERLKECGRVLAGLIKSIESAI